jgi:aryl-phospho-beta-D-glucosidase BglC (GH1 family)
MMNRKICTAISCVLSASVSAFGDATFSFTNQWSGGGQGAFRISNGSTQALQGWTLEFDWNADIGNVWNGVIQSHVGNHYVIAPAAYNAELPAGGVIDIGCVASFATAGLLPTSLVFSGGDSGGGGGGGGSGPVPTVSISDAALTLATSGGNSPASGFLSTVGNQIVDSNGNPVRISGVNWFGFETSNKVFHGLWTRGYKSMLDQVKQLGFNTLRIPFSNETLRAGATTSSINFAQNPDLQGLTPLQCMDKVIEYCGSIGLRVILDRHSAKADNYLSEDVWFIAGDSYHTEQRWIADWVMLAQHYAGNPTVIGADLFNEPKRSATWGTSSPLTDWNKAAERCGNAVLAANPSWLIIVEGVERYNNQTTWWGGNLKGVAIDPVVLSASNKLVYSMHEYPKSVYAQTWFNDPTYPNNMDDVWNVHWGYIFKNQTAPLLLGEFGSKLESTSDEQWLDKLTDYIDGDLNLDGVRDVPASQLGMSWTYWSLNPNSGDTGGILKDDWTTVDTAKMAYIQASQAPLIGSGAAASQRIDFPITLSEAPTSAVSVTWGTANGTALAGINYLSASGVLTIPAGQLQGQVSVVVPAQAATGTKQFTVQLSAPVGATLLDSIATGTLRTACANDLDGNGVVDGADLGRLLGAWGPCSGCNTDLDGDGATGGSDLGVLLGSWGSCP